MAPSRKQPAVAKVLPPTSVWSVNAPPASLIRAAAAASSRPTARNAALMMAVFLGSHPGNSARLLPGPRARHKDFEDLFNGGGTALSLTC